MFVDGVFILGFVGARIEDGDYEIIFIASCLVVDVVVLMNVQT